jgi:hypothetical protein
LVTPILSTSKPEPEISVNPVTSDEQKSLDRDFAAVSARTAFQETRILFQVGDSSSGFGH